MPRPSPRAELLLSALLFTLLSTLLPRSHAAAVVAPRSFTPANVQALRALRRVRLERRRDDPNGLDECFSVGAICPLHSDLDEKCSAISSTRNNGDDWYKCLCTTGWLSTNLA